MNETADLIEQLRALRAEERRLRTSLVDDLRAFQKKDDFSFFTGPWSNRKGISVASTCTGLMALIDSNELDKLVPPTTNNIPRKERTSAPNAAKKQGIDDDPVDPKEQNTRAARELFAKIVKGTWASSGLEDLNAFTTCMVIRAAGFLLSTGRFDKNTFLELKHAPAEKTDTTPRGEVGKALASQLEPSLQEIIQAVALGERRSFSVPGYPPKTTMAYWFIDGITKAQIDIPVNAWKPIVDWAANEFYQQLAYVVSGNDPLMDPASLAMAACLTRRIRKTCAEKDELLEFTERLPSRVELVHAIHEVFAKQTDSGIWHKAFPLFHFPGSGAADYCFSFEFLEAILIEFAEFDILAQPNILESISRAVNWCENNRFKYQERGDTYYGWNAGGAVENLVAGKPEAWATGAVHMFLAELDIAISKLLDKLVLSKFGVDRPRATSLSRWSKLINVDLQLQSNETTTLKDLIEEELIKTGQSCTAEKPPSQPLSGRRSALLFGPPGTSKTTMVKAIAERLGWPFLLITPSHFLSNGLDGIYVRANEIFQDLMEVSGVVILFDEMDALAQKRGNAELDVTRQLLTTSMLPKLAELHDQARVIFLMATNHREGLDERQGLDEAIIRPGRFDLLICVGPPSWDRKLKGLSEILKKEKDKDKDKDKDKEKSIDSIKKALTKLSSSAKTKQRLDRFTVADVSNFLEHLKLTRGGNLSAALNMPKTEFEEVVSEWAKNYIALSDGSDLLKEHKKDMKASRRQ